MIHAKTKKEILELNYEKGGKKVKATIDISNMQPGEILEEVERLTGKGGQLMPEYKSREYCRDINCYNQLQYDNQFISKKRLKTYCQDCKAYKFHKWLQENNYKIVKEGN